MAILVSLGFVYWLQTYLQNTKASFDGIRLTCNPRTSEGSVGEELQLSIALDTNNKKISAVDMIIDYDPKNVKILTFKPSNSFPFTLRSNLLSNQARFIIGVDPEIPFVGVGILGKLKVKILSREKSQIQFNPNTKVAELESDKNELSSTVPCIIN
jgi:hypothetical protein